MNLQNLNSFNIVLPSNWVTNGLYPENRPSHYKTRLVEKIILTGDWEAAMSRISYPQNWENIRLSGTLSCQVDKEEPNESVDPINRFFWTEETHIHRERLEGPVEGEARWYNRT